MQEPNPWQFLSRREIYDNPWIHVDEDRVVNPGGGISLYGRIHFKNQAIGIIPLDRNGNTWLVGQYRYVPDAWFWEIPMGGSPDGERVLESAQRELREETGLTAASWRLLIRLHTSNSVTDEEGFVFVAEDLREGEPEFEETEDLRIWKLPLADAVNLVMAGEITDAISVAGLLRLAVDSARA